MSFPIPSSSSPIFPTHWTYAQSFVLADAMFSGMHANSFPAHVFFAAAQSPAITNPEANDVRTEWGCDAPTGTNVPVLQRKRPTQHQLSMFQCHDHGGRVE